jgi:hypothetical protein
VEHEKHPPFLPILLTAIFLALVGWAGLYFLVMLTDPELGPRWLFYFLLTMAVTGTALPLVAFLNRRFPTTPPADEGVLLRQTTWVGVYFSLLMWLQSGRILNTMLAAFLAVSLALIEAVLRLNERTRFNPGKEEDNA